MGLALGCRYSAISPTPPLRWVGSVDSSSQTFSADFFGLGVSCDGSLDGGNPRWYEAAVVKGSQSFGHPSSRAELCGRARANEVVAPVPGTDAPLPGVKAGQPPARFRCYAGIMNGAATAARPAPAVARGPVRARQAEGGRHPVFFGLAVWAFSKRPPKSSSSNRAEGACHLMRPLPPLPPLSVMGIAPLATSHVLPQQQQEQSEPTPFAPRLAIPPRPCCARASKGACPLRCRMGGSLPLAQSNPDGASSQLPRLRVCLYYAYLRCRPAASHSAGSETTSGEWLGLFPPHRPSCRDLCHPAPPHCALLRLCLSHRPIHDRCTEIAAYRTV